MTQFNRIHLIAAAILASGIAFYTKTASAVSVLGLPPANTEMTMGTPPPCGLWPLPPCPNGGRKHDPEPPAPTPKTDETGK